MQHLAESKNPHVQDEVTLHHAKELLTNQNTTAQRIKTADQAVQESLTRLDGVLLKPETTIKALELFLEISTIQIELLIKNASNTVRVNLLEYAFQLSIIKIKQFTVAKKISDVELIQNTILNYVKIARKYIDDISHLKRFFHSIGQFYKSLMFQIIARRQEIKLAVEFLKKLIEEKVIELSLEDYLEHIQSEYVAYYKEESLIHQRLRERAVASQSDIKEVKKESDFLEKEGIVSGFILYEMMIADAAHIKFSDDPSMLGVKVFLRLKYMQESLNQRIFKEKDPLFITNTFLDVELQLKKFFEEYQTYATSVRILVLRTLKVMLESQPLLQEPARRFFQKEMIKAKLVLSSSDEQEKLQEYINFLEKEMPAEQKESLIDVYQQKEDEIKAILNMRNKTNYPECEEKLKRIMAQVEVCRIDEVKRIILLARSSMACINVIFCQLPEASASKQNERLKEIDRIGADLVKFIKASKSDEHYGKLNAELNNAAFIEAEQLKELGDIILAKRNQFFIEIIKKCFSDIKNSHFRKIFPLSCLVHIANNHYKTGMKNTDFYIAALSGIMDLKRMKLDLTEQAAMRNLDENIKNLGKHLNRYKKGKVEFFKREKKEERKFSESPMRPARKF